LLFYATALHSGVWTGWCEPIERTRSDLHKHGVWHSLAETGYSLQKRQRWIFIVPTMNCSTRNLRYLNAWNPTQHFRVESLLKVFLPELDSSRT